MTLIMLLLPNEFEKRVHIFSLFSKKIANNNVLKSTESISTKTYMRTVIALPKTYPTSVAQFRLKLNGERKDPSKGPYGSSKRCNLPTLGTYHSFHSTTTSYMTTVNTWAQGEVEMRRWAEIRGGDRGSECGWGAAGGG